MAAESGKFGCAKFGAGNGAEADAAAIYEVIAWNYNEQQQDVAYRSCQTNGQVRRVDGAYDITGTVTVVYDGDNPFRSVVYPGLNGVLYLYKVTAGTGREGKYDRIPCKILGVSGGVNINEGGLEQFEVSWGYHTTDDDPTAEFDQSLSAL